MAERVTPRRRGSYGIDAPFVSVFLTGLVVLYLVLAIVTGRLVFWPTVLFTLAIEALHLHFTLRGKFVLWAELLDRLRLRGDERILDLGCGRGAVFLMAAQHLTTGRAVGVDLWRTVDQSGNSAEATQRNAIAEGVADRVELHTGDMTALPFEDSSFEVVVSSLAIHNISGRIGREKAISEAVRVLRPGGRLLIVDVRGTRQHQAQLAKLGMHGVGRTGARMVVLASPSRDRHEATTWQLRWSWYFHGLVSNQTLHLTGRAVKVSQSCTFLRPAKLVAYLMQYQEQFRDRLIDDPIEPPAAQPDTDKAAASRPATPVLNS